MKKIILIHVIPLIPRLRDAYLINDFIAAGYKILYFDISKIFTSNKSFDDELNETYVRKFNSYDKFTDSIKKCNKSNTVFILPFDKSKKYSKIFVFLKSNDYYLVRINIYPMGVWNVNIIKNLSWLLFSYSFLNMIFKNFFKLVLQLFDRSNRTEIFDNYFSCSLPCTNFINNPDFEKFIKIKNEKDKIINRGYLLFLDSYFPLHPECFNQTKKSNIHAINYYKRMRDFFDYLENRFEKPVIIAAHPSSSYTRGEFGDRQIIKNKTLSLVKDADIILQHGTLSHIFALLFDKPLVFIITNQMRYYEEMFADYKIRNLAAVLGKKAYNIDKTNYDKIEFTKVEKKIREKYIYSQLTTKETENITNKEIILTEFERIFRGLQTN